VADHPAVVVNLCFMFVGTVIGGTFLAYTVWVQPHGYELGIFTYFLELFLVFMGQLYHDQGISK